MSQKWTIEKAQTLDKGGAPFLFMLTNAQRYILLSLVDVLSYTSTWSRNGIPEQLTDAEQAVIDDLIYNLMEYEHMDAIADAIKYFADKFALQDFTDDCCSGALDYSTGLPAGTDSTVYDYQGDPPEGFATWDAWKDARCEDANWLADELIRMARAIGNLSDMAGAIGTIGGMSTLLLALFPPAWAAVVVAIAVMSIATTIMGIIGSQKLNQVALLAENWDDNKAALVELIYLSFSADSLVNNIDADIQSRLVALSVPAGDASIVSSIFTKLFTGEAVNLYFASMGYNAPDGYIATVDCSTFDAPSIWLVPAIDNGVWADTLTEEPREWLVGAQLNIKTESATYGSYFCVSRAYYDQAMTQPANVLSEIAMASDYNVMTNTNYDYNLKTYYIGTGWTTRAGRSVSLVPLIGVDYDAHHFAIGSDTQATFGLRRVA